MKQIRCAYLLAVALTCVPLSAGTQVSVDYFPPSDFIRSPDLFVDVTTDRVLSTLGVEVLIESNAASIDGQPPIGAGLFEGAGGLVSPPWEQASAFNPLVGAETSGLHFESHQQVFASAVTTDIGVGTHRVLEFDYFLYELGPGVFDFDVVLIEDGVRGDPIQLNLQVSRHVCLEFDGDGDFDIIDFGIFADNYGRTDVHGECSDLDADGDVDIIDFGLFADNFGLRTLAVPEPSTVVGCITTVLVAATAKRCLR